jgi:hypothetical protein
MSAVQLVGASRRVLVPLPDANWIHRFYIERRSPVRGAGLSSLWKYTVREFGSTTSDVEGGTINELCNDSAGRCTADSDHRKEKAS